jgi:hypothetical protein
MGHLTVVYKLRDKPAWDAEWARIRPLFLAEGDMPVSIVAISKDDEMTRLQMIEEAGRRYDDPFAYKEVVGELIACGDMAKWQWPE